MAKTKILTIRKEISYSIAKFGALLAIAVLAPLCQHQAITGVIVNAALFVSVMVLGVQAAVLIAIIPSFIALSIGLLPPILSPMVPFIIAGNIILILCFAFLQKKNYWLGIITASALKFLFLFGASYIVVNLFVGQDIAIKVSAMFGLPQLLTALAGGIIVYLFFKSDKKYCSTR